MLRRTARQATGVNEPKVVVFIKCPFRITFGHTAWAVPMVRARVRVVYIKKSMNGEREVVLVLDGK